MELHFKIYLAAWLSACLVAAIAMVRLRAEIELFQSAYWVMLTQPWKVFTFLTASNIFASGVLYVCAGLFWSLEWRAGHGVHFGFTQRDWLVASQRGAFVKVFWTALPLMVLVGAMTLPFIL